ncbi:MAG TPA: hypothetical protein VIX18_04975 [Nitrospirota bacterium]
MGVEVTIAGSIGATTGENIETVVEGTIRGLAGRTIHMYEAKDFATGCLTILLCVVLFPLFFLVFKLTIAFAILLAMLIGVILGITVLGRIVRLFFTGK